MRTRTRVTTMVKVRVLFIDASRQHLSMGSAHTFKLTVKSYRANVAALRAKAIDVTDVDG